LNESGPELSFKRKISCSYVFSQHGEDEVSHNKGCPVVESPNKLHHLDRVFLILPIQNVRDVHIVGKEDDDGEAKEPGDEHCYPRVPLSVFPCVEPDHVRTQGHYERPFDYYVGDYFT
jgi:hypothetical protein